MKVEAIRLVNFMAFEDTGWVELRPITLLFGLNSSGKSALIRALLLLKQSLDADDESRPLAFLKEDGLVDLGDFATAVHRKSGEGQGESQRRDHLDRSIIFGFRCDLTGEPVLDQIKALIKASRVVVLSEQALERLARVELLIGFGLYEGSVKADLLDLRVADSEPSICLLECRRLEDSEAQGVEGIQHGFVLNSDVIQDSKLEEQTIGLFWRGERGFWTTFADPMPLSFERIDRILGIVQDGVESFLRSIVHIGPIRPQPERVYALRASDQPRYVRDGLAGWYDFLRDRVDADQARMIAEWVRRLGLAERVEVRADKDAQPIVRSQVSFDRQVEGLNLKDVGFGASQVLPVILAAVLSQPDALVVIEQPELHLHTSAQIEIGDLFIQAQRPVKVGDQWMQRRFLLESHSEHLLLRFQRQIGRSELLRAKCIRRAARKGIKDQTFAPVITCKDALVVFVVRQPEGHSEIELIALQDDGQVINPSNEFQDFFQQDYEEVNSILDISAQLHALRKEQ